MGEKTVEGLDKIAPQTALDEGYPDELEGLKLVKSDTAESGYKVFVHVCAVWTEVWGHSAQSFTFQNGCHSHHSGENDVAA